MSESTPIVRTPRLRMREFGMLDAMPLRRMHLDPRVRSLLIDDHPLDDPGVSARFVAGVRNYYRLHEGLGIWPTDLRSVVANGAERWAFCGWFSLVNMADRPGCIEIGCRLMPSAWGAGLAFEGGRGVLQHAFVGIGRETVNATCHPRNRPVMACLLALGFRSLGEADHEGQWAHHFEIDHDSWQRALVESRSAGMRRGLRALEGLAVPREAPSARVVHREAATAEHSN